MLSAEIKLGKRLDRRAFKACHHCSVGKRQCENARPCEACCSRGLACREAQKDVTCAACRQKKVKCDKKRPCGRCSRGGIATECAPWLSLEGAENSRIRRRPDAAEEDDLFMIDVALKRIDPSRIVSDNRPRLTPTVALMHRASSSLEQTSGSSLPMKVKFVTTVHGHHSCLVNSRSSSPEQTSGNPRPVKGTNENGHQSLSVQSIASLKESDGGILVLSPERPVPFPEEPFPTWFQVLSPMGPGNPWPRTLQFVFKCVRTADHVYQRILDNTTPKLLSAIIRVFRACDELFPTSGIVPNVPQPPQGWELQNHLWKNSSRCGRQTMRFDRSFGVISGLDVNQFWSDLAGLHREEFISRAFAGENLLPTSELRQTVKLFKYFAALTRARLKAKTTGDKADIESKPTYMRWSRDWGRHDGGSGVLLRMQVTSTMDPENDWAYLQQTAVEVTPEEYESARARDPEACEGYMIPVVGSKSAAELLSPQLAEEESLAHLSSHPAGRATLDRFAEQLERDYAFVFEALDTLNRSSSPANICSSSSVISSPAPLFSSVSTSPTSEPPLSPGRCESPFSLGSYWQSLPHDNVPLDIFESVGSSYFL